MPIKVVPFSEDHIPVTAQLKPENWDSSFRESVMFEVSEVSEFERDDLFGCPFELNEFRSGTAIIPAVPPRTRSGVHDPSEAFHAVALLTSRQLETLLLAIFHA
jgi:hypothetical protein